MTLRDIENGQLRRQPAQAPERSDTGSLLFLSDEYRDHAIRYKPAALVVANEMIANTRERPSSRGARLFFPYDIQLKKRVGPCFRAGYQSE